MAINKTNVFILVCVVSIIRRYVKVPELSEEWQEEVSDDEETDVNGGASSSVDQESVVDREGCGEPSTTG